MKKIKVFKKSVTALGKLYPRYDSEAEILEVSSHFVREWPYGIDIDGTIIFDLDSERTLANFDLLIPMPLWRIEPEIRMTPATAEASIEFTEATIEHKSFHLPPILVRTDPQFSCALITFGTHAEKFQVIKNSESVNILCKSENLVGFFIILS